MATLYVDFTNGNDANDATTFANRVKTITSGITAARTAPGDTIRLMKSEDPVSLGVNGTFTNQSQTVTLGSAVTANIDTCETTWTGVAANVTQTTSATRKEGSLALQLAVAAAFTTGQIAYKTIASTNFSAYTKVSFWIRTSIAVASGVLKVSLCSDTLGVTAVNSFTINEPLAATSWKCITFDNAAALGSAIQSISIDAISDPGTVTILLDNILACTNLTLTSLISLNSSATSLEWYPVKSINGTTVIIDQGTVTLASTTSRGYSGTTTTATCYKREPIRITAGQTIQETAALGSISTYSGGWDTTNMSTQTGITFIDLGDQSNTNFSFNAFQYINVENLAVVRGNIGFSSTYTSTYSIGLQNCAAIGTNTIGFNALGSSVYMNNCYALCNNSYGIGAGLYGAVVTGSYFNSNITAGINQCSGLFNNCSLNNNSLYGVRMATSTNAPLGAGDLTIMNSNLKDNGNYGAANEIGVLNLVSCTAGNNATAISVLNYATTNVDNFSSTDATVYSVGNNIGRINVSRHGGSVTDARVYERTSAIAIQITASPVHGTATKSWQHIPTALHMSNSPLIQKLSPIAVLSSGTTFTFSIWVQRDSTNVGARVLLRGGQVTGVATDVIATASAAINTWEQLTITASPTQAVPIVIELQTWQSAGSGNIYWGDAIVTQQ